MGAGHTHPRASAVVVDVLDSLTLGMFRKTFRSERPVTTREAASVLGRAGAAMRNRPYEERKAAKIAQLRAEQASGWPIKLGRS